MLHLTEPNFEDLIQNQGICLATEGRSQRTIDWYASNLIRFLKFLKNRQLPDSVKDIGVSEVRNFIFYLQNEVTRWESSPHTKDGRRLSPFSVQGYVRTIKAFWSWLMAEGYISNNPMERLREQLKRLSLNTIASMFEDEATKAGKSQMSYTAFLARLVDEEVVSKTDRSVNARIAKARFPAIKTLESFDFAFQTSLPAARIKELAELGFIDQAYNVLFVGPTGTGKTHLSIALGLKGCAQRKRVLFTSAMSLLDQMVAATVSHTLGGMLEALGRLDLLIVDELGYMPIDTNRGNLFFQMVSRRYEKGSTILTTNKPFDHWGEMFGDDVIASAILDRLLHYCHIVPTSGSSYRIKDKLDNLKNGVE